MVFLSMRFAIKHAVASAVVISVTMALTAASYIALFVWAVVAGEPLGGPLAFPFMVLSALLASVLAAVFVLLPTTVLTEWICRKRGFRVVLQIPIATVCMGIYVFTASLLVALLRGAAPSSAALAAAIVFGLLLVPLGAYWWSMQSADWLSRQLTRWWQES
jgi:hypothetical protein